MNQTEINKLTAVYHRQLSVVDMRFKRYLHTAINWNARIVGIRGARGVGKTTLLLQHIKETHQNIDEALWVSLDNLWFATHDIDELVDYLYMRGVNTLYFDEIHKLDKWSTHLKNYYDNYPDLKIVYTGSSMLEIDNSKADLSRRQTLYTLEGMSFREYLEYEHILQKPKIHLEDILHNHVKFTSEICSQTKILQHFEKYLREGVYPFYKSAGQDFYTQLATIVNLAIESDMPAIADVSYATIEKTKKLLMIIAQNVPFEPTITKLNSSLETTRDNCLRMLYTLDRANIINIITRELKNYKHLVSPEKIYLNDTNIMHALGTSTETGTVRETFFANQLAEQYSLQTTKNGDFVVGSKYRFEVGGPNKSFDQIKDMPNSYLAIDGIETGYGNRIPLYLFGFLY